MSSKGISKTITPAKPHTQKKFHLITSYVDEWARKILGIKKSEGVIYIDCMSNSGKYYDDNKDELIDGTAILVAVKLNEIIKNYPNKKAIIYYNDKDKNRIKVLKDSIKRLELNNLQINYSIGDANKFLKEINIKQYSNYNTLMVYDPYEASIDWDAITPFLNIWGEVIINHMVSDTIRGVATAQKESVIRKYERTYQSEIDQIIELGMNKENLEKIIRDIIHKQCDGKREHFIASFPFYNRKNGLVYNLIHCSSNINGLILYKKIAWKTFGGKSSLKNSHGKENQLCFDMNNMSIQTNKVENCYFVEDIAKYIYTKYGSKKIVSLEEVYEDINRHPIFPSDGFKQEIKRILKNRYNATFPRGKNSIEFKNGDL